MLCCANAAVTAQHHIRKLIVFGLMPDAQRQACSLDLDISLYTCLKDGSVDTFHMAA